MNPFNFLEKQSNLEITLKNGKKVKFKGKISLTPSWVTIETQQNTSMINKNEIIKIKETRGE